VLGVLLVALAAAVCAASWLKSDLTANDFERFADLRLTVGFFALFTGLSAVYVGLVGTRAEPPRWQVTAIAVLAALFFAGTFPVGSKDVFYYVFYGKMWGEYGANPYLVPPQALAADDWYRFLHVWTSEYTVAYGPLFVLQMRALYGLAGTGLATAVAAQKLLNLVLLFVVALLLASVVRRADSSIANLQSPILNPQSAQTSAVSPQSSVFRALTLWLWSPLVLFESAATGHNDLAMAALVFGAAAAWMHGRSMAGWVLLGLSVWYKWYSVVLVPLWLLWAWRRWGREQLRVHARRAALVGTAITVALLAPFAGSLAAMAERALTFQGVRMVFPDELPPPLWVLFRAADALGLFARPQGPALFDAARFGLLLVGFAFLLWRRRGQAYAPEAFLADHFWSIGLFLSFVPTMLWPWHLVPLCAFGLALADVRYDRGVALLTVAGLLSYFLTFAYALLLCALVVGALAVMRLRR
jgi:hypothetical protein